MMLQSDCHDTLRHVLILSTRATSHYNHGLNHHDFGLGLEKPLLRLLSNTNLSLEQMRRACIAGESSISEY